MRNNKSRNIGNTTTSDLTAVAQDMLRMGAHWAQAAQNWLDQRRVDMQQADVARQERSRNQASRSDRDIQSDFSGGGYDQVDRPRAPYGYKSGGYRGVGPGNYTRSDDRIREDLNERLTEADDLDASGLTVEVSNGIVTLGGNVDQRWMKHRTEDLADSCSGVRDVRNQIRVGGAATGTTSGIDTGTGINSQQDTMSKGATQ